MPERVVKVRLTAQVAEYASAMEQAAASTREVGTEAEKTAQKREAFNKLGNVLLGVGTGMTALTLAVAKTGIEYNTLQQTSRAALTTLLGGAKEANAQMDKLDAFARTSPFSKATFITAQQQMLAFGVETKKVIPYLDAIQDAVAAAGGGNQELSEIAFIMAQISSAGKITAQDLMQFGQRGVNAAELIGSQMGKTGAQIRDEITAGTLDADDALDSLAYGMKQKFDGAADNVKNTFAGAMDRVKAAWRDLSSDLMKPLVDPSGGGALVDFLNWTADIMRAVQALPEPVKLAGGALFAFAGFVALASGALFKMIPKFVEAKLAFLELSGAMRGIALAGGIAGIALVAIVGIIAGVAAAQADAARKAEAYADTLEEGTQRVTKATRDMAKENLAARGSFLWWEDTSAIEKANELGLNLNMVQEAALGNAEAMKELRKAQEEYDQAVVKDRNAGDFNRDDDDRLKNINAVIDAVKGEANSLDDAIKMAELKQKADQGTASSSETVAEAYTAEATSVSDLRKELTDLIDTINKANGVNQDAVTANSRYLSALEGISAEVQKQKDAYEEANGTLEGFSASLDENTASGSANASMLADVAGRAQDAAQAQFDVDLQTMSADEAVQKYNGTLALQRQAFIDSATGAGFNADQVRALADRIFQMPTEKEFKAMVETAQAQSSLDYFIKTNDGRQIRVKVAADGGSFNVGGINVTPNATGGLYSGGVKKFAAGEFLPGIYPATPGGIHHRVMSEAGYDEMYGTTDPKYAKRTYGIWSTFGDRMGFSQQSQSQGPVQVSLAGAVMMLMVDGNPVRAVVQEQIVAYDNSQSQTTRRGVR